MLDSGAVQADKSSKKLAKQSKPSEVLRIGTSGDYPPFSLRGSGFDIEIANTLAKDLGMRIEWVQFRWPDLERRMRANEMDIAVSGITWLPERAVDGRMSVLLALGSPCVVGEYKNPKRISVNRGGAMERWTRHRYPTAELLTHDVNLSVSELFAKGEVDAFITDSFMLQHLKKPDWPSRCAGPDDSKVIWVSAAKAESLGPKIDKWIRGNERWLDTLREQWFGQSQPITEIDRLQDLIGRRMVFMQSAGRWRTERGGKDNHKSFHEQLAASIHKFASHSAVEEDSLRKFFRELLAISCAVAKRPQSIVPPLEPTSQIRPTVQRLDDRIMESLALVAPVAPKSFVLRHLNPLRRILTSAEQKQLQQAVAFVSRSDAQPDLAYLPLETQCNVDSFRDEPRSFRK